jgi:DNA-directed RNA polymerase subunit RPC12/RpoP
MAKHSFFDEFFSSPGRECTRCGTTEDLHVVGDTGGSMLYICTECREKREAELQESIKRGNAEIDAMVARDEWEES